MMATTCCASFAAYRRGGGSGGGAAKHYRSTTTTTTTTTRAPHLQHSRRHHYSSCGGNGGARAAHEETFLCAPAAASASITTNLRRKHAFWRLAASSSASPPADSSGNGGDGSSSSSPSSSSQPEFLGIAMSTLKKVVPLALMMFCILFNYTILRDTKDVLVVTAPGSGAEIIPFLKTYVNLPAAIGFAAIYARLSNLMDRDRLFYTILVPFVIFFGAFAFIMYPARDTLHPTEFCIDLLDKLGPRFMGPIAIVRNWTYCLFYVMAELWGSVVVSVLFWGFANQIMEVKEAKQFYPLFGLIANVALIFSGQAVRHFSTVRAGLPPGVDGWGISLKGLMSMIVVGGLCIAGIYWALNKYVLPAVGPIEGAAKKKKEKLSMSIGESVIFLAKSAYVRNLATLVVAYGISINLVEVTWKSKLKTQYPDPNDYSMFMGNFSTATGTVTFVLMIVSRYIFAKFGWGVAAAITPMVILITGATFFSLILTPGVWEPVLAYLGFTPLFMAVLVGAAQNVFSKGAKYSLFDPCKEMAYIPLDEETKVKGKAAIDVICNPLGKSGGSLVQQLMIFTFGSLAASTPYLGVVLLIVITMWLRSAARLSALFEGAQQNLRSHDWDDPGEEVVPDSDLRADPNERSDEEPTPGVVKTS